MKEPAACKNMADIRKEIDAIDDQIVQLISRRAEYVYQAAKFKKTIDAVRDEQRVQAVIESKKQLALSYGISPQLIGDIYQTMIDYFVNEEIEKWKRDRHSP
jgi:isochorismate pyruvate lyase